MDAVIFVFSLESQESIEIAFHYYEQMAKYRNINEIPVMMVATQVSKHLIGIISIQSFRTSKQGLTLIL